MKKLLIASALLASSMASVASTCDYRDGFSDKQWNVIRSAYVLGYADDTKWSMAAISIAESSAGESLINNRTQDYGVYQINVYNAMRRLKTWEQNGRDFGIYDISNKSHVTDMLIGDIQGITSDLAKAELKFWMKSRKGKWNEIWGSYTKGYYKNTVREKSAIAYSNNIASIITNLKSCEHLLTSGI